VAGFEASAAEGAGSAGVLSTGFAGSVAVGAVPATGAAGVVSVGFVSVLVGSVVASWGFLSFRLLNKPLKLFFNWSIASGACKSRSV
jgi:hypothetical protein